MTACMWLHKAVTNDSWMWERSGGYALWTVSLSSRRARWSKNRQFLEENPALLIWEIEGFDPSSVIPLRGSSQFYVEANEPLGRTRYAISRLAFLAVHHASSSFWKFSNSVFIFHSDGIAYCTIQPRINQVSWLTYLETCVQLLVSLAKSEPGKY